MSASATTPSGHFGHGVLTGLAIAGQTADLLTWWAFIVPARPGVVELHPLVDALPTPAAFAAKVALIVFLASFGRINAGAQQYRVLIEFVLILAAVMGAWGAWANVSAVT